MVRRACVAVRRRVTASSSSSSSSSSFSFPSKDAMKFLTTFVFAPFFHLLKRRKKKKKKKKKKKITHKEAHTHKKDEK